MWYFSRAKASARGCGRQPFTIGLRYRSARYDIVVENPRGAGRGVSALELDGVAFDDPSGIPLADDRQTHRARAVFG